MDPAELAVEGAGLAILGAVITGFVAVLYERRRLMLGVVIGMALALAVLPFVAYLAALITNHHATDVDLHPPVYLVATALTCAGLSILGLTWGAIAEARHQRRSPTTAAPRTQPDDDYHDDPREWLPWGDRRR